MMSALSGIIWTAMIITMKAARPRKRNIASAIAASSATNSESATTATTMIRLFLTLSQK